jgi:hypothetical protein
MTTTDYILLGFIGGFLCVCAMIYYWRKSVENKAREMTDEIINRGAEFIRQEGEI